MSGRTILSYAVGAVVGIAVAFFTAGIGLAAYATLAGTMAFGVTASLMMAGGARPVGGMGMKGGAPQSMGKGASSGTVKDAASADLNVASASEAVTVPVVFGSVKMSGNMLQYDRSTFRAEPIIQRYEITTPVINQTIVQQGTTQQQSSGKGSLFGGGQSQQSTTSGTKTSGSKAKEAKRQYAEQIVGYKYYLSWDYGLCMGPIDSIGQVWDAGAETVCGSGSAFSGNSITVGISGKDHGGTARIYRGSSTQVRTGGESYAGIFTNYRHVAFCNFTNFYLGETPYPKTYALEVRRFPRVVDVAGATIAGFPTRGSDDMAHPAFNDANPAAVLWEVLTNKIWGRGLSPDLLDVDTFKATAIFFESRDIGVSFSMDAQDVVSSVVDTIRSHCDAVLIWTGEKIKCRCLSNPTDYVLAARLTSEQVLDPEFSRPAWPDVPTELRVEFTNRGNNYKAEIVLCQDDAAIAITGVVNSTKMSLNGFSNRDTASKQAQRILGSMSYPRASLSFRMNRWESRLEPGDLVQFDWSEWSDGSVTSFWRVAEMTDADQSEDGIQVVLSEDLYATSYEGEPEEFATPGIPFESSTPPTEEDIFQGGDQNAPLDVGDIEPIRAWEMNVFLSGGSNDFILTCERGAAFNLGVLMYWSPDGDADYELHTANAPFALTGALLTGIGAGSRDLCRFAGDTFQFSLNVEGNEAALLSSANKVQLDADDMQVLPAAGTDLLLVGGEVILCGNIELVAPGVYEVSNYLRACFGSTREAHAIADVVAFIPTWTRVSYASTLGPIPKDEPVDLRAHVMLPSGEDDVNFDFEGPSAGGFVGKGSMPFTPALLAAAEVALAWTVKLRPRFHDRGAQVEFDLQNDVGTLVLAMPDGMVFAIEPFDSGVSNGPRVDATGTFVPDDGNTAAAGVYDFAYTAPAGTDEIRVWAVLNGIPSLAPLSVMA